MSSHSRSTRSIAEWVTLGLSVAVVGSLVLVALFEESQRRMEVGSSLSVTFDKGGTSKVDEAFYIPFTVTNTGSGAISSADIWIEVQDGEDLVESAEITVEFLPLEGKQHGIYVSAFDPGLYSVAGRLESLQFP